MSLQEKLAALGREHGPSVFLDADAFRGAIDDYLDESTAPLGTIILLTDAVRLGAVAALTSLLDNGARPEKAVDSVGRWFARERGTRDVPGSKWAVAAIGQALGRVPRSIADALPPPMATGDPQPAAVPAPVVQRPTPPPPPPAPPTELAVPQAGPHPPLPRPPADRSRTGAVLAVIAALVVLAVGSTIAVVVLTDDDPDVADGSGSSDPGTTPGGSTEPEAEPPAGPWRISGAGYSFGLPTGDWNDLTAEGTVIGNSEAGSVDAFVVLGESQIGSRGSILVQVAPHEGDQPRNIRQALRETYEDKAGATTTDVAALRIDGRRSLGLAWDVKAANGAVTRAVTYLALGETDVYVITCTALRGDKGLHELFPEILKTWEWE